MKRKSWIILLLVIAMFPVQVHGESDSEWNTSFQKETIAFVEKEMQKDGVPGAAIVVVKDGKIAWSEGFGWADQSQKKHVDPAETLFPVGSVSKLFTAVAAMQQVERRNLELHQDVNYYLEGWSVPPGEAPLTLHDLLTHTGGLEDVAIPLTARTPDELWTPQELLMNRGLCRADPPGKWIHYSNDGIVLVGHLVEQASGQPFLDYMEQEIFTLLGMKSTTYRQVLPDDLSKNRTVGYHKGKNGSAVPNPPYWLHGEPAATLTTTPLDQAAFMQNALERPTSGKVILRPETWEQMMTRQFSSHSELPGIGYGFFEMEWHGETIWMHEGSVPDGSSLMMLVPEEHLGIFVVHNMVSFDAPEFNHRVADYLLSHLIPGNTETRTPSNFELSKNELKAYIGEYRSKGSFTTQGDANKMLNLLPFFQVRVQLNEDGTQLLAGESSLIPLGNDRFAVEEKLYDIAFGRDEAGKVNMMYTGSPTPIMKSREKIAWFDDYRLHYVLWGVILAISIGAAWWFPIQRWFRSRKQEKTKESTLLLPQLACTIGWLQLLFIGSVIVFFLIPSVQDLFWGPFRYGIPLPLRIAGLLPFAGVLLSIWLGIQSARIWSKLNRFQRLGFVLVASTGIGLIPYLAYWNWLSLPWS